MGRKTEKEKEKWNTYTSRHGMLVMQLVTNYKMNAEDTGGQSER